VHTFSACAKTLHIFAPPDSASAYKADLENKHLSAAISFKRPNTISAKLKIQPHTAANTPPKVNILTTKIQQREQGQHTFSPRQQAKFVANYPTNKHLYCFIFYMRIP